MRAFRRGLGLLLVAMAAVVMLVCLAFSLAFLAGRFAVDPAGTLGLAGVTVGTILFLAAVGVWLVEAWL